VFDFSGNCSSRPPVAIAFLSFFNMSNLFRGKQIVRKRTPFQHENDINFCMSLYLKGYTMDIIAKKLNKRNEEEGRGYTITSPMVYYDIKRMLMKWKRENLDSIEVYLLKELKKLDAIEVEAWEAWEMSKKEKTRKKMQPAMDGDNALDCVELIEETTAGDPRYLDLLLSVQQRRAKLLGLDAPTRIDLSKPKEEDDPNFAVKKLPQELIFSVADKLQEAEYEKQKLLKNGETVQEAGEKE